MNQFFYTRTIKMDIPNPDYIEPKEGEEASTSKTIKKEEVLMDSFNINKVLRSVEMEKGKLTVLLDDIHRRVEAVPIHNKRGQITGQKNQEVTYQSEIYLTGEDVDKFRNIMSI